MFEENSLSKKNKNTQKINRQNDGDSFFNEGSPPKGELTTLKGIYEVFLAYFNEKLQLEEEAKPSFHPMVM